jgi:hypothetical protein
MMKKLFFAMLVLLHVSVLPMHAQQATTSEMNKIKSNVDYVYGESTLPTSEEAFEMAFNEMFRYAITWASDMTNDSEVELTKSDVRKKSQALEGRRGQNAHVLCYVKRSQLAELLRKAGYSVTYNDLNPEEEEAPQPEPQTEDEPTPEPQPTPQPEPTPVPAPQPQPQSQPQPQPQPQPKPETLPEGSVISIEGLSDDQIVEVYLYTDQKMTPEQEAAVERAASRLAERNNVTIGTGSPLEQILSVTSFYDLKSVMTPLKLNGEITKMGKYTTMREPEKSYLIIYDPDARIRAVLAPGRTQRKNLRTGLMDAVTNYGGCGAIWFQLNE